jgi:hypothetical protein
MTDHRAPPVSEQGEKARGWLGWLLGSAAGPLRRWAGPRGRREMDQAVRTGRRPQQKVIFFFFLLFFICLFSKVSQIKFSKPNKIK